MRRRPPAASYRPTRRIAIELAAQPTPIRQILRHTALELSPMPVGPQMRHLMDEHVFEILGRQQPQLQIQPDATGPRRAGSPTGRHRTQCDMRRTFADDCGPMLHQCRQPRVDRRRGALPALRRPPRCGIVDETDRLPAARRTVRGRVRQTLPSLPYALLLRQYPRPTFTREPFYLPVGHPQRCGNHDVALRRFDAQIHVLDGFARYVQHQTVNNQHLGVGRSGFGAQLEIAYRSLS